MRKGKFTPHRSAQRGQTIALVAICLVVLLAAAALAIDLTTLYVAGNEMQRTADAAALAGAKAMVDSGVTNDPGNGTLQGIATTLANGSINAVLAKDTVGGEAATLVSATPNYATSDVQITVKVQRTDVPTFFAHIFGQKMATVSASATAEAYNPSGQTVPVAPKCVKPWIIANSNPLNGGTTFVDPTSGAVTGGGGGVVGNAPVFKLCLPPGSSGCNVTPPSSNLGYATAQVTFAPGSPCPSCDAAKNDYEQSIDCCNNQTYQCGETVNIAAASGLDTGAGIECLIHATGPGSMGAQDTLDTTQFPNDGPFFVRAGSSNHLGVATNTPVSTSDSLVTLLIANTTTTLPTSGSITVVGFVRAFVSSDDNIAGGGDIHVTFVNVAGCNTTQSGTSVSGGGTSPIPVRLIHP